MTSNDAVHIHRQGVMNKARSTGEPQVIHTMENANRRAQVRWELEKRYPDFTFTRVDADIWCALRPPRPSVRIDRDAGVTTFVDDDGTIILTITDAELCEQLGLNLISEAS